jgi:hypothetical protein
MLGCFLEQDEPIGHKVLEKRKGLFGKEVYLKEVSYNSLIKEIESCELDEIFAENFYNYIGIKFSINQKIELNRLNNLSLKNESGFVFSNKLEKRIKHLKFEFTELYLKRALKILEKIKEN